jgi:erythromycin esterase-like protein
MNALVVKDAEEYYRCMLDEDINSWNIRDTHMTETLQRLMNHITKRDSENAKVVVWAHNSHVGDARETDMGKRRGKYM